MKASILSGMCLLGVALSTTALAENRGPGWEIGVDVKYQDSTDITFEGGSSAALEDDIGFALTFGYRFNSRLELQFALDWETVDYDVTIQSAIAPSLQFRGTGELESFTPRIGASFNFLEGDFTPYVNGTLGWSFVDTNIPDGPVQVGCWWDPWWGQICAPYQSTKSIDDFAYSLGVGARWDFSDCCMVRLGYEKRWFDYSKATSTPDFDEIRVGFSFRY
jgi:opacity protein-like surface antigen